MAYTQDETNQLFGDAVSSGWAPKQIYQSAQQLGVDNDQLASAWNVWNTKQGIDAPAVTGQQVQDYALQQGFDTSRPATADGYSQAQANQLFSDAVQSGWKPQDIYQGAGKLGISTDQLATAWNAYNTQQGNNYKPINGQQVYNYASQQGYTPQSYEQNIGTTFTGLGITSTTGYGFLPEDVKTQIKNQGKANQYALLDDDGTKSLTVNDLLQRRKVDPSSFYANITANNANYERQERSGEGGPLQYMDPNQSADDLYLWNPGGSSLSMDESDSTDTWQPEYVSKDEFLKRIGTTNTNARVAFSRGGGMNSNLDDIGTQRMGESKDKFGHFIGADGELFDAAQDPNLKGFVQLGDGGTLFDDIPPVLDKIYKQLGIQGDAEKQEQLKKQMFRYDPRFGVLMDQRLLSPVMSQSANSGSQGGFFGKHGAQIAIAALTAINPLIGAIAAAGYSMEEGAKPADAIKAGVTSYISSNLGALAGEATSGLLGISQAATPVTYDIVSGGIKGVGGGVLNQLSTTGSIDPKLLATQGLAGGVAGGLSGAVTGGLQGVVNSSLAASAGKLAGTLAGNAITGKNTDLLSAGMGLLPGIAKEAGNLYKSSGGWT